MLSKVSTLTQRYPTSPIPSFCHKLSFNLTGWDMLISTRMRCYVQPSKCQAATQDGHNVSVRNIYIQSIQNQDTEKFFVPSVALCYFANFNLLFLSLFTTGSISTVAETQSTKEIPTCINVWNKDTNLSLSPSNLLYIYRHTYILCVCIKSHTKMRERGTIHCFWTFDSFWWQKKVFSFKPVHVDVIWVTYLECTGALF